MIVVLFYFLIVDICRRLVCVRYSRNLDDDGNRNSIDMERIERETVWYPQHDPHIRMAITMGDTINDLDVNIGHMDADLTIQVAHNEDIEPYAWPYVVGHSRHPYAILPRAASMRAVRCCADVSHFANELEEFDSVERDTLHYGEAYDDQSRYDYLRQNVSNDNQRQRKAKLKRSRLDESLWQINDRSSHVKRCTFVLFLVLLSSV